LHKAKSVKARVLNVQAAGARMAAKVKGFGCRPVVTYPRWRTMRRPRNPVPPNTVTRREDMTRKYRAALGYAIIFSALPEAKQASAQARRIRRVTPSDEFQACARPSFASRTEGSNPAPSSEESANPRSLLRRMVQRRQDLIRGSWLRSDIAKRPGPLPEASTARARRRAAPADLLAPYMEPKHLAMLFRSILREM
jgi:hypothetical protein